MAETRTIFDIILGIFKTAWESPLATTIIANACQIILLLGVGIPLITFVTRQILKYLKGHVSEQVSMLVSKGIFYGGMVLLGLMLLPIIGIKELTPIVGAAGVVGVAVGFAAQTSFSNIISGLFLISERPFAAGDLIKIGETKGFVTSINLLSIRLRTLDNQQVRIPNEYVIKNVVTNVTHFPILRLDIDLSVSHRNDLEQVMAVLKDIADKNVYCLDEPDASVQIQQFGASNISIRLSAWFAKDDYLQFKNSLICQIQKRFREEEIEIASPSTHNVCLVPAPDGACPAPGMGESPVVQTSERG
ncbi:MAG TPA: mechanosensitive ion channel [Candidatus Sumerlaeota bacterium]|nr:mechanosensitive ion channel [Candidatus Sumerlaeota bacterium]